MISCVAVVLMWEWWFLSAIQKYLFPSTFFICLYHLQCNCLVNIFNLR